MGRPGRTRQADVPSGPGLRITVCGVPGLIILVKLVSAMSVACILFYAATTEQVSPSAGYAIRNPSEMPGRALLTVKLFDFNGRPVS